MSTATVATVQRVAKTPTTRSQAEAIVDRLGLGKSLKVRASTQAGDDGIVIQGYVKPVEQRRQLLQALQGHQSKLEIQVWATDVLEASVKQALNGMRIELDVTPAKDGKVTLTGVLPGSLSEDQLRQALLRDVLGRSDIDLHVVGIVEAALWLATGWMRSASLIGLLPSPRMVFASTSPAR